MGRVNRVRQKETKKASKLIKKRVVGVALLAIALIFYPIQKLGTSHKPKISYEPTVPEPTKATMEQKKANKKLARRIAWVGYGWKDKEWVCLDRIFYKEAKYDHLAKNQSGSSAYGIGQRLKETSKDPMVQILHTYKYIQHRYKNPCSAWKFHVRNNYY
jgi:hypothetical protein